MKKKFYKKPKFWIIVAVVGLLGVIGCRKARWFRAPIEKKVAWIAEKVENYLDLTDEQRKTSTKIKNEIVAKVKEMKKHKLEMADYALAQIKKEKLNEDEINQKLDEKEPHRKEMRRFFVKKIVEFHAILTPEQKVKLAEKLTKLKKRFHK